MTNPDKAELRRLCEEAKDLDWVFDWMDQRAATPGAILSLLDEIAAKDNTLLAITTRHFAESWNRRSTDEALEDYLSAGIAQLQKERDAALAELDQLRKDASAEMFVTLTSELAAQRAELEACRKDAERYRWLRARPTMTQPIVVRNRVSHLFLELMDKSIDAAMLLEANHA